MGAAAIVDGIKVIAAAGTAVPLVATSTLARWILLSSHEDNTGTCTAGASTVVHSALGTQRGADIPKPVADSVPPLLLRGPIDLADVYVDGANSADSVHYLYQAFGAP